MNADETMTAAFDALEPRAASWAADIERTPSVISGSQWDLVEIYLTPRREEGPFIVISAVAEHEPAEGYWVGAYLDYEEEAIEIEEGEEPVESATLETLVNVVDRHVRALAERMAA